MNAAKPTGASRLRLRPLAMCLAIALGVQTQMAPVARAAVEPESARAEILRTEARGEPRSLEQRFPPGHPWHNQLREVLERQPPDRPAGAPAVTNCNDTGPGSLRNAVLNAVSGDSIDLTGLGCSTITLSSGALVTGVDDLTLNGPGANSLSVLGNNQPVLAHVGSGTVTVSGMTVSQGVKYSADDIARGGCIYSQGNVALSDALVKYCEAESGSSGARGGGIFAEGQVIIIGAEVRGNDVIGGLGGGVFAGGGVTMIGSRVTGNSSSGAGGGVFVEGDFTGKYASLNDNESTGGLGGALALRNGSASITSSTIGRNTAVQAAGGDLWSGGSGGTVEIIHSTVAENIGTNALMYGGGIYSNIDLEVVGSTISGNIERHDQAGKYGGGLSVGNGTSVGMVNSIVSGNLRQTSGGTGGAASDIRAAGAQLAVTGYGNLIGNLINATVPSGTRRTESPRLGPLADNGGPTLTMIPLRRSPAINGSKYVTGADFDQRGTGFARQVGQRTDIGAVETDTLMAGHFETFHSVQP